MEKVFRSEGDFPWQSNPSYPDEIRDRYRYRELIREPGLVMGTLELLPGAEYPPHAHPAHEVYYVQEGQARWQVDQELRHVQKGDVIRHTSGAVHSFTNTGETPLKLMWIWWDRDGRPEDLETAARLV